jgi:hypothetical protein
MHKLGQHSLIHHPQTPPRDVGGVTAECSISASRVTLLFRVDGSETLALPPLRSPQRRDGLWRKTCFEMFVRMDNVERYFEFNLSPSSEWAAYAFDDYRQGMKPVDIAKAPQIKRGASASSLVLEAQLEISEIIRGAVKIGLSAVIDETDGTKSYWALAHPPGEPDFHHPTCFALTLPAPEGP